MTRRPDRPAPQWPAPMTPIERRRFQRQQEDRKFTRQVFPDFAMI